MLSKQISGTLQRTIARLEGQSAVPISPGRLENGRALLCAGAAFVFESDSRASTSAEEFAAELSGKDTNTLRAKAALLGLDLDLVDALISLNDSFGDGDRQAAVCYTLRSWR